MNPSLLGVRSLIRPRQLARRRQPHPGYPKPQPGLMRFQVHPGQVPSRSPEIKSSQSIWRHEHAGAPCLANRCGIWATSYHRHRRASDRACRIARWAPLALRRLSFSFRANRAPRASHAASIEDDRKGQPARASCPFRLAQNRSEMASTNRFRDGAERVFVIVPARANRLYWSNRNGLFQVVAISMESTSYLAKFTHLLAEYLILPAFKKHSPCHTVNAPTA